MSNRQFWFIQLILNGGLVLSALYLQKIYHLDPCPLCVFQRCVFILGGALTLLAYIHNPNKLGQKLYAALFSFANMIGILLSLRHIWLQNLPPEKVPACGPGLDYLLQVLPLNEVIRDVLIGSGNCAKIDYLLLGITLPSWSLIWFLIFSISGIYQYKRKK